MTTPPHRLCLAIIKPSMSVWACMDVPKNKQAIAIMECFTNFIVYLQYNNNIQMVKYDAIAKVSV
jgi:hypothetical protein